MHVELLSCRFVTNPCSQSHCNQPANCQPISFPETLTAVLTAVSGIRIAINPIDTLYCTHSPSLSFLLLFAFLLVEAHVGLWAPCRQQWLVELVQVSCVTLVHRLWRDGWQEVIRVMRSHCIREEGRKAGCHRAKCMSMVTICQARRVPIVAVLTIRNQVAHQGLQGHVALRTNAFYRRTGLLLSPTSTEQKWQISETPFSPANVNMCELSSNTKLSPAFTRVIINHPIDHSHDIIAILSLYRLSHKKWKNGGFRAYMFVCCLLWFCVGVQCFIFAFDVFSGGVLGVILLLKWCVNVWIEWG